MFINQWLVCLLLCLSAPKLFAYDLESTEPFLCKENPELVGECFTVHGRVGLSNGAHAFRLWVVGTKRMIAVSLEGEGVPGCVLEHISRGRARVFGDFLLCPFTEDRPGWMRLACIESAENLVVQPISSESPEPVAYFPEARSCELNP